MTVTRSRGDIRSDIVALCNIEGQTGANGRHPEARLNAWIDQAARALRDFALKHRYRTYVESTPFSALPTAPVSALETYAEVELPATLERLLGIDVLGSGTDPDALTEIDWSQRRLFTRGRPTAFSVTSPGRVSGSTFTPGRVAIFPTPTGGLYSLQYLERWEARTNDGDLYLGETEDWFGWIYHWVAYRIQYRDNDRVRMLAASDNELNPEKPNSTAARIVAAAPNLVLTGPRERRRIG